LAYLLRFDFDVPPRDMQHMLYQLPFVMSLQMLTLLLAGVYSFIWRYVGMAEIKSFILAALWSALPLILLRIWLPEQLQPGRVPFSITVMDTVFAFGGVLGLRVVRRALYERSSKQQKSRSHTKSARKPVLLVGAGRAGVLVAREIRLRGDMGLDVKGFIDDDPNKLRSVIQGIKVLGTAEDIPRLVSE